MTSDNNSKPQNGKKRGPGFYLKVIVTFVLLIGLSAGIALYYFYYQLTSSDKFEQLLAKRISEATKMNVKFEKLDVSFPGFAISNVTIATDSPKLKLDSAIDNISITPDVWAAINGQLILDSLSISSASTDLEIGKLAGLTEEKPGKADASKFELEKIAFPFNNLSANSIAINLKDHTTGKTRKILLKNASLEKSLLSSSLPFSLSLFSDSYGNLDVNGKIYWPDSLNAQIKIDQINEEEIKQLIPEEYKKQLAGIGKPELDAELSYKIKTGQLNIANVTLTASPQIKISGKADFASTSPVTGSASLNLAPVDAKFVYGMVKSFVPNEYGLTLEKGKIAAAADLGIQNNEISSLQVKISPEQLVAKTARVAEPVSFASGMIVYDLEKVELKAIKASLSDSNIELTTGKVGLSPFSLEAQLAAQVNFDKTWPIITSFVPKDMLRVTPTGAAGFSGKINYKNEKFVLGGDLSSDRIGLKESATNATANLENIKVKFIDLTPTSGKIQIESLSLMGVGGKISAKGAISNAADPGFDLSATGKIDLKEFSALAASIFKLPVASDQFSGNLGLDFKLGGTLANLKPSGNLTLSNVKADLRNQGLLIANLNGASSANPEKLKVDNLSADLVEGKLKLDGTLSDYKKPVVSAQASLVGANLEKIRQFIKTNFPEMPGNIEISGKSDLSLKINGAIAAPDIKGNATVKNARFFHPAVLRPIDNINGPIDFDNNGLTTSGINAKWGTSLANVSGSLKDWGKLVSDFSFTVNPLDATDAAGFFLKESGYKLQGTGNGKGKVTGAIEKIKVFGDAYIPQGVFSAPVSEKSTEEFKFPFNDLAAKFNYFDKVFTVESAETKVFQGNITAKGKVFIDKDPIEFQFDTKLNQIETSEFLKTNTKYSKALRGGLDGSGDVTGNTSGLNSLNGKASLLMKEGAYTSPPVVQKICEQFSAPHLASGPIDNVSGDYVINNGRISSNNTMAKSKDGKMVFKGSVGLDTTVDGTMTLVITNQACQKSSVLKKLVGKSEYLTVPVSVKGTLTSPSIGIPLDRMLKDAAEKQIKSSLEEKAKDALGSLLGGKKQPEAQQTTATATAPVEGSSTEKAPEKKIEENIKNLGKDLKKIFKF
jgi:hypothetical protein